MPRTALIIAIPEAEHAVVAGFAAPGVPAHITVLYPFAEGADVDESAIAEVFAAHPVFEFELTHVEQFDNGIVWLRPEPSEPFEVLTAATWRRFPDYPPYENAHDIVIPHLTVSEVPIEVDVDLPIHAIAREVTLIEETTDGRWWLRRRFPLQGVA